ncbi:hypothetical protein BGZ94_009359 [Podila epigama]|nr:hypothetical protein BGZ94_009359 [Podila epigama]
MSIEESTVLVTLEEQVLQLADHEAWLDMQIRELEYAVAQDESTIKDSIASDERTRQEVEDSVDALKRELATLTSMESINVKVLEHVHAYPVLVKELFKQKDDSSQDDRSLSAAIQEQDAAVSEYLHMYNELQNLRKELSSVQMKVLDCQDENRILLKKLNTETAAFKAVSATQEPDGDQRAIQKIEEDLKNVRIKYSVVSNVLMGLLLESDIDWSKDPHYLSLMLKLGGMND